MAAVSTATALAAGLRPGSRRLSRGRARGSRLTSGSRRSGRSRGGWEAWLARAPGMITKTHKEDLGLGVPEKKKKKKKKKIAVVQEPETQYSVLNSDDYFSDVSPTRPISPFDNVGQGQVPEMPLGKKKKKKKDHHTFCTEPLACARLTNSPSTREELLDQLQCLSGKKKKKRKSLSLAVSQTSEVKTSPGPKKDKEVSRAGKKLKKHKKEKKTRDAIAFSTEDPWLCEAGDALYAASLQREEAEEQAALGQKRKQGSPREHSLKKKKKKAHQESDTLLVHSRHCRSVETSPGRGRKKQPVEAGVVDYIPIGDSLKSPGKKKGKSKKKAEQPVGEELAVKTKKKKRRKESRVAEAPLEKEEEEKEVSDADLEVVLEKKGNIDETYIDQVRRKALQEEIDRESGKTEAWEPRKWAGTQFGQWDTAGFENEEQRLKFLKLMGGFKHLSPSFSPPLNMTGRPNMALSKKAADTLQQNLQQDYDRAMSWKYSRGAGLGFSTSTDKIFYIDRNASKSIKFDD